MRSNTIWALPGKYPYLNRPAIVRSRTMLGTYSAYGGFFLSISYFIFQISLFILVVKSFMREADHPSHPLPSLSFFEYCWCSLLTVSRLFPSTVNNHVLFSSFWIPLILVSILLSPPLSPPKDGVVKMTGFTGFVFFSPMLSFSTKTRTYGIVPSPRFSLAAHSAAAASQLCPSSPQGSD